MLDALRRWARTLKREILTLWMSYRHPDIPLLPKLLAILVVAYAFSPIDLIPDFIPVLGLLDELILLPLAIRLVIRLMPDTILEAGRKQALAWQESHHSKPRNWVAAGAFALIWMALAALLWRFSGLAWPL